MRWYLAISALAACCSAGRLGPGSDAASHEARFDVKGRAVAEDGIHSKALYRPLKLLASRETGTIEARDTTNFTNLVPSDSAHMMFGKLGDQNQIHVAHMTLYADSKLPIVMMEAFEGLTSAVDCNGNDGHMSLTFNDADAYNHAINEWSYINEDTDKQFLMITNHDSCGPKGQRQCYRITDVDNDDATNVVRLTAVPADWKEVAGTFDMEFGKASIHHRVSQTLRARGLIDWLDDGAHAIKHGFDSAVDKIESIGDGDMSKSVDIPFSVGTENKEFKLFEDYTNFPAKLKLYCTNCFAKGTFETTGSLKVSNFVPTSLVLEVSPQDFEAAIELKAELAQLSPMEDAMDWDETIVETAIPGAGIDIPRIFTLGAKAAFNIQGHVNMWGTTTLSFGAKTRLPNGKISIDLINPFDSSVSGFGSADVDPSFDMDKTSITATFVTGPQIELTLGVEVFDNTGFEAGVKYGIPDINLNVTAGYDENGWCSSSDSVTSGIKVVSAANLNMWVSVKAKAEEKEHSLFLRKLVNIPFGTFFNKCWSIAGITPPRRTTASTVTVKPTPTGGNPYRSNPKRYAYDGPVF